MDNIHDLYGRSFKTLRVSLTNICNLACAYCVDPLLKETKNEIGKSGNKLLSTNDYVAVIDKLNNVLKLETIRLTGGEPMLYKEIIPLVERLKIVGIPTIKMTSNGTLLKQKAKALKSAGVSSINISLDAVRPDVSLKMSNRKNLHNILEGIESAIESGILVKINSVIMKGMNDDHVTELFNFCKQRNISIRFLELMQMGHLHHNFEEHFVSQSEILKVISKKHSLTSLERASGSTANYWTTNDGFTFGVVANVSSPFCNDCNRLRLDSYGNIFGCLSNNTPISIINELDNEAILRNKLLQALDQKKTKFSGSKLSMLHIGG